ncbi:RNA-directed DNA polymerase, eukaryota, reverse transcriptase zinc-binding domain protein [Tanacetum coccineum]
MNVKKDGDTLLEVNGKKDTVRGMGDEMNGEKVMNDEGGVMPKKNADCDISKSRVSNDISSNTVNDSDKHVSNKPKADVTKKSYAKTTAANVMFVNELKYNVKRMWGKYGLSEMVSNKPLVVQRWDINMCVAKTKPNKLPIWVKMSNTPFEAWSAKGISALASRIGKPLIIDAVTAGMCQAGMVRNGFARVLVKVDALKELPSKIDVAYKNKGNEIIGIKMVQHVSGGNKTKRKNDVVTQDSDRNKNKFYVLREYDENGMNENDDMHNDNKTHTANNGSGCFPNMYMDFRIGSLEMLEGVSFVINEMQEFRDCVNMIEVEDMCSSGLFFTWTKNLKKAREGNDTGVLKKLDRFMVNEEFMKKFNKAHVIFNPYIVSDHSQAVVAIPNGMKKKKKKKAFNMKITHICFADDLLVLCHGDDDLVQLVRDFIDEFGACTGMLPNFNKSTIFFARDNDFYWCTIFLLPKAILKEIDNLLMGFLWCNRELSRGKAKIAWKKICKPKSHGGLGLKDLELGMENLLEIRDEIISSVWYKLGNGRNTSMWFDNWCELGPLFRIISNRSLYFAKFLRDMMIAYMVSNGEWKWPSEWKIKHLSVVQITVPNFDAEKKDWLVWKNKDNKEYKFSIKELYKDMRV